MEFAQKSRYAPNLNARAQRILRAVLSTKVSFDRPVSVERERQILERRSARRHLYLGLIIVAIGALIGISSRKTGFVALLSTVRSKLGF
jgi:hypothetical protein